MLKGLKSPKQKLLGLDENMWKENYKENCKTPTFPEIAQEAMHITSVLETSLRLSKCYCFKLNVTVLDWLHQLLTV